MLNTAFDKIYFFVAFLAEGIYAFLISFTSESLILVFSLKNLLALTLPCPIFSPL
jgi:hypothetical protein